MLHNMHVASICFKCLRYFIRMLQVFHLDVACVCNGCKCFRMFFCKCFRCILKVLQVFHTYVISVLSKYCKDKFDVAHATI
jgi:hypothetical protein